MSRTRGSALLAAERSVVEERAAEKEELKAKIAENERKLSGPSGLFSRSIADQTDALEREVSRINKKMAQGSPSVKTSEFRAQQAAAEKAPESGKRCCQQASGAEWPGDLQPSEARNKLREWSALLLRATPPAATAHRTASTASITTSSSRPNETADPAAAAAAFPRVVRPAPPPPPPS